jgi:hypothetical protein
MDAQIVKVGPLTGDGSPVGAATSTKFVAEDAGVPAADDTIGTAEKLVADVADTLQLRRRSGAEPGWMTRRPLTPEQELAWQTFWFAIDHPPRPPRLRAWLSRLIRRGT